MNLALNNLQGLICHKIHIIIIIIICKIVDFAVPADHRIKLKECEKKDKYFDHVRELKKKKQTMEPEGDNYTNCNWCFGHSNQRITKGTGGVGSGWTNGDHPNNNIIENGQNTEKSLGDLRRLAVAQTPVKDHQLRLMWKTPMEIIIIPSEM